MNLGLLTAIWGRPRLTELVLKYYCEMPLSMRVLVNSPNDEYAVHWKAGTCWNMTARSNEPLSDKWNHGMNWAGDWQDRWGNQNGMMIVGSDDLVTPQYIDAVKYLLEQGADYIYLPSLYFYNLATGRMQYCLSDNLGLGRVLSRRLLDMLDWQPWPEGLGRGLDNGMWQKIKELKEVKIVKMDIHACHSLGIAAMDIKGTDNNIWSYDHATMSLVGSEVRDPEATLRKHFPSVADELLNWKDNGGICRRP